MITRDPDTRNLIVTPEDIPALMGLALTSRDNLLKDQEKIPGSLRHIYDAFIDCAERLEKAIKDEGS